MRVSLLWLRNFVNLDGISPSQLAKKLTLAGFEVEEAQDNSTDTIFDITTTANRGDTMSLIGIAREIAALYNRRLCLPSQKILQETGDGKHGIFLHTEYCDYYSITLLNNIDNTQSSPKWLQSCLEVVGIKPTNVLEDIKNYVSMEYGQPVEMYDISKINLKEPIKPALDWSNLWKVKVCTGINNYIFKDRHNLKHYINKNILTTTVNDIPISISGIVGSSSSCIDNKTTDILLETAIFDSKMIRDATAQLQLETESSARFICKVNPNLINIAHSTAIDLITKLTGGKVIKGAQSNKINKVSQKITLNLQRAKDILGDSECNEFTTTYMEDILNRLEFRCKKVTPLQLLVEVPAHRLDDVEQEIDLIEEIGRIHGFNQIQNLKPRTFPSPIFSPRGQLLKQIKMFFFAQGFTELLHYSFATSLAENPYCTKDKIELLNPLTIEQKRLRSSLLSSIVETYIYNCNQKNGAISGFEISKSFSGYNKQIQEKELLAGIIGGYTYKSDWSMKLSTYSWSEGKGLIENFFNLAKISISWTQNRDSEYLNEALMHHTRWGIISSEKEEMGVFAQLHPRIVDAYNLPGKTFIFELNLDKILLNCKIEKFSRFLFQEYSYFPTVSRDITIQVNLKEEIQSIISHIYSAASSSEILESVELFDDYRSGSSKNKRNLSFRLLFRSTKNTLKLQEIEQTITKVNEILAALYTIR